MKKNAKSRNKYIGKWELLDSDVWSKDWIDLSCVGFIEFTNKGDGQFQLGALRAWLEYVVENHGEHERAEFCWVGVCEGDDHSGRGWVETDGIHMTGHLYIYGGDNSKFSAEKFC